jgi:hypothetical protein
MGCLIIALINNKFENNFYLLCDLSINVSNVILYNTNLIYEVEIEIKNTIETHFRYF